MKRKQYICKLLTDVIVNQKAATEGSQATLDFIPGNNFLGIVASKIYNTDLPNEQKLLLFHSGKLRFGDAHPFVNGVRLERIPAAWYVPKLNADGTILIHHHINDFEAYKTIQPKQCRMGFIALNKEENSVKKMSVVRNFVLKSAYDKVNRKSKDEQMYGYQSIEKDMVLSFELFADDDIDDSLLNLVDEAMMGRKRVGRSRSAQFGLVDISSEDNWQSYQTDKPEEENHSLYLYAESRLIFLDEYGNTTFTPKVEDLNVKGNINWGKSQIRTFQYAPWNYKRQARDTDRCGIEKGSVIVVDNAEYTEDFNGFVGVYQNEGFGRILVNPDFLKAHDHGISFYQFQTENSKKENRSLCNQLQELLDMSANSSNDSPLLQYLKEKKEEEFVHLYVYSSVVDFVNKYHHLWNADYFSSQWGNIRNLAMCCAEKKKLLEQIDEYLTHGIAKQKWDEKKRYDILMDFLRRDLLTEIEDRNQAYIQYLADRMFQPLVITLAAEMAKANFRFD